MNPQQQLQLKLAMPTGATAVATPVPQAKPPPLTVSTTTTDSAPTPLSSTKSQREIIDLLRQASSEVHSSESVVKATLLIDEAVATSQIGGATTTTNVPNKVTISTEENIHAEAETDASAMLKAMGITPKSILKTTPTGSGTGSGTAASSGDEAPAAKQSSSPDRARSSHRNRRPGSRSQSNQQNSHDEEDDDDPQSKRNPRMPRARRSTPSDVSEDSADDSSDSRRNRSRSSFTLNSRPSAVAERLRQSNDRPWSEGVRASFASYTQEMMFRNMRRVEGVSSAPGSARHSADYSNKQSTGVRGSTTSVGAGAGRRKSQRDVRAMVDRLVSTGCRREPTAAEKRKDPTLQYTLYDDAKECTFRPKINKRGKSREGGEGGKDRDKGEEEGKKADAESNEQLNFIARQENMEREKVGWWWYLVVVRLKSQYAIVGSKHRLGHL